MQKISRRTVILLITVVLTTLVGCFYHSNTTSNTNKSVKIIVKGLSKVNTHKDIKVHISGVNLDINEDLSLENHFRITETYQNVSELMKGLEIKPGNLSQGKWRIAIELIGWKTACSTLIQEDQVPSLIFRYQEHLCP